MAKQHVFFLGTRRLRKLIADPHGFLRHSQFAALRALGGFAARRLDAAILARAAEARGQSVGIIVTAHNAAAWIGPALASLARQSHARIEVVVVDDASTDATHEIAAGFAARDRRFRLLANAGNCGPYLSRNRALATLATPFITFQDADDVARPERIARQLGFLLHDSKRLACVCSGVRVNENGDAVCINGRRERMEASTLFFHRERVLQRLGFFDAVRFAGDAEFVGRIRAVFGLKAVGRQHEVLLTASFRADSLTRLGPGAQHWQQGTSPLQWTRTNSPQRIAYAKAFTAWHSAISEGTASPCLGQNPNVRPFPAPEGLAVLRGTATLAEQLTAGIDPTKRP